jgi:dUTP pyrophosphatase
MIIDIVRTDESLPLPEKASEGASGFDLRASIKGREGVGGISTILSQMGFVEIHPGQTKIIPLGIKIGMDLGYEVQIRARSGLAIKNGITLVNGIGTIDADYRGEVMAGLINLSGDIYRVKHGDRICQMVAAPVIPVWLHIQNKLDDTTRGTGGMGSTGDA